MSVNCSYHVIASSLLWGGGGGGVVSTQPKIFGPDTVPLPKSSVMGVFSELNQYRSSIGTVSDQYAHIRPVQIACLRAVFVELI